MKHINHHLLGDTKYRRRKHNKFIRANYNIQRLLLHASELEILHPYSQEKMRFKAPLDVIFLKLFEG